MSKLLRAPSVLIKTKISKMSLSICHTSEPCKNGWTDWDCRLGCGFGWAQGIMN